MRTPFQPFLYLSVKEATVAEASASTSVSAADEGRLWLFPFHSMNKLRGGMMILNERNKEHLLHNTGFTFTVAVAS